MARAPFCLPGMEDHPFPTKKACRDFLYGFREFYNGGAKIDDEQMHKWLTAALLQHPYAEELIGCGIDHFTFEKHSSNIHNDAEGCTVVRTDGSRDGFAIDRCLQANPVKVSAIKNFREAIRGDIVWAKSNYFDIAGDGDSAPCQHTGKVISDRDALHVDHCGDRSFNWIVTDFMAKMSLGFNDVAFGKDQAALAAFADYHRDVAIIRFLDKQLHLSRGRPPEHLYGAPIKAWLNKSILEAAR